jgi:hypothetical protein
MNMKKYLFTTIVVILLSGSMTTMWAQNTQPKAGRQGLTAEQIQKRQCDQMVNALMLDDATSAKFVPIYEQYLNDMKNCRKMGRTAKGAQYRNNNQNMTDAEIDQMIRDRFKQSRKMLDIRESYYSQFRKVLTPKQMLKMYGTERNNMDKAKKEFALRKQKMQLRRQQMQQRKQNATPSDNA